MIFPEKLRFEAERVYWKKPEDSGVTLFVSKNNP